jgi:nucleoside-diphosphate-sugar epimerase
MSEKLVLVTGGSGFIAARCIVQLLAAGYSVRTTVRSLSREADVRAMIAQGGDYPAEQLTFAVADLLSDAGWPEAVAGCEYVLHVASPFPMAIPKHDDELIRPAREGALRALRASRDAGVKRVVLTSSFAAIGYGHAITSTPFTEADWTDLTAPHLTAYVKSKTLAERAAWDFIEREGGVLELSVVNPVAVFGPVLGRDFATSVEIVKLLLDRAMPACPRLSFGAVDVRDVAEMHLLAMTNPAAKGERFLAVAEGAISLVEMARLLKAKLGPAAARVPTSEMPDWILRMLAPFSAMVRQAASDLGNVRLASNEKARRVLGWSPRSNEEAVLAAAESLVRVGALKSSAKQR